MGGSKSKSKKRDKDGGNPAHQPEKKEQGDNEKKSDGSVESNSDEDQNQKPETSNPKKLSVKENHEAFRPTPIPIVSVKRPPEITPSPPVSS